MDTLAQDDPEDILSASLDSLYGLSPVAFSTAGSVFTYPINPKQVPHPAPAQIELSTPATDPSNWSLHASFIWASSLFIADHLEELQIDTITATEEAMSRLPRAVRVLELGAGAGLPSILLAHMYPHVRVTISDYPDDRLIRALTDNVCRNGVSERCYAVAYAWGTPDVAPLLMATACDHHTIGRGSDRDRGDSDSGLGAMRFDVVFAADTLWNPELHAPFLHTLCVCLKRRPEARIHLVAGLHTGRYAIQSFLNRTQQRGLVLLSATEREVGGTQSRPWDVSRAEGGDERERRKWVVWVILKWEDSETR